MGDWNFSGDEALFFIVAGLVGLIGTVRWYWMLVSCARLSRSARIRVSLAIAPVVALLGLAWVLTRWSDPKTVVEHFDYQLLFLAGGVAWMSVTTAMMPVLGISTRYDAIERSNPAAASAVCGAILGLMAIYAGGNVGSGPTIWTTIAPAIVATIGWFIIWFILELISRPSEAIAIDRDFAGGIRHAGFVLAIGLIVGRAIAGDWTSWQSTFEDMLRLSGPVLPLLIVAAIVNRLLRPTAEHPQPDVASAGVVPAAVYVTVAIAYLLVLGPADIGKHIVTYEQYMNS